MCSSARARWTAALCLALATACGGTEVTADPPSVAAVKPGCGDAATAVVVTIQGTLPVKPIVSLSDPSSSSVDKSYRAWVGAVELSDVTWRSASELTAIVPAGIQAGTYAVTVQGPFGSKGTLPAAFEARQGACPIETASLGLVDAIASPATLSVGQELAVTVTVRNVGQAAALGVLATVDSAPAGFTLRTGPTGPQDVPAGQARTFSWTYLASAPGGGVFVIGASGSAADTGLAVTAPGVNTNVVLVSAGAFLSANAITVPARATVGQLVTVILTATNHAITDVVATPALAVTGPVLEGSAPVALTIPAGASRAFQWTFTASAPGTATFTASVSGDDPFTGEPVTVPTAPMDVAVQGEPRLSASLSTPAAIELGDFTVTMVVTNDGGTGAADVVEVTPDLPAARAGSTAAVTLKSGPVGAPATVPAGQAAVTFTWVFTATSPGALSLTSAARGKDANRGTPVASSPADSAVAQVGQHRVGGTVTGLLGSGLQLRNGAEFLPVAADGPFTFAVPVASGGSYAVTVETPPVGPSQTCTVANGTGTVAAADVTNVTVTCATNAFSVGGVVAGLAGRGLILQNGAETLPVAGNGPFTFPTPVASGGTYAVTVAAQPRGPTQVCTVSNGAGTVTDRPVTTVSVTCATRSFTVGGAVSGLTGSGLVLQNGTEPLPIGANGQFTFASPVASGGTYAVTVSTQPTGPSQTCTVSNGSGTVTTDNVTSVSVACTVNTFTVGGTVTGLAGTGLVLRNGTESLPVAASGTFTFATRVASGGTYAVTVSAQPAGPSQVCTVSSGSGTVTNANVTSVAVSCSTSSFTVGGSVTGLLGTGLVLHNGVENLPVTANGAFAFTTPVASGGTYAVTVSTQPAGPSQVCTVTGGSGTVTNANVTSVAVSCSTSSFTVGGTVTGLLGTGLVLHNGAENLPVTANGAFTFATPVASGGSYAVTVSAQPAGPSQVCTVSNGSGTVTSADVTGVAVSCSTSSFTVGGTVSGLSGTGLVLHNGAENLPIGGNGPFTFATPVASGGAYAVTVQTQPTGPSQVCTVSSGSGTVTSADVTGVAVSCSTSSFTVGGTVSGLSGAGLVLHNGSENLAVSVNGPFTFATPVASGGAYAVTVQTQPTGPSQVCTVSSGSGTVTTANVTSVSVSCATSSFTVGGTVTGLSGSGLVLHNGSENLPIGGNGAFTFATPVASGSTYAVTVSAQPTGPSQTCTVSSGSGTVTTGDVTSVSVTCIVDTFTVGGTVLGLTEPGLALRNGGETLSIAASGPFTFATPVPSGQAYAVTVEAQPLPQSCVVSGGADGSGGGTVGSADVTSILVSCTP